MDVGCYAPKPLTCFFCVCGVFVWLQFSGHFHTQLRHGCRDVQPRWGGDSWWEEEEIKEINERMKWGNQWANVCLNPEDLP